MNAFPFRKIVQDRRGVIAQSNDGQPELLEFAGVLLQLHELRFAERSPVGRAVHHHDGALGPQQAG